MDVDDDVRCIDGRGSRKGAETEENINISDVIEVIETDLDASNSPKASPNPAMYANADAVVSTTTPIGGLSPNHNTINNNNTIGGSNRRPQPIVLITEQPASKALRFRYECEGRSAGSIPGATSTPENKTYPTIQIQGYQGKAVVVVSCVTKDPPYRAHPHNLVGRDGCKKGVCTLHISEDTMTVQFSNLGIQCIKKKEIEAALKTREDIRVDPFRNGFSHRNQPTSIDLNAVRLAFQVFIYSDRTKSFTTALPAIVSHPIYDKKAMTDLSIVKLSDCCSLVDGGRKDIILLCEKVAKEDVQIRFYEERDGVIVWEDLGDFQPSQVHKQTAIWFRPPRYHRVDITEPVRVNIQLRRPSDGATSVPLPYDLLPLDSVPGKRKRDSDDATHRLPQEHDKNKLLQLVATYPTSSIKPEPRATSPYEFPPVSSINSIYAPQVSPSQFQYRNPVGDVASLGPTPPPGAMSPYSVPYASPTHMHSMASTIVQSVLMPDEWNIPSTSTAPANAIPIVANVDSNQYNVLLNPDNNQISELPPLHLCSGELGTNNLSENFSTNLSLTDIGPENTDMVERAGADHNMTDSLTRLTNVRLDQMMN